MAEQYNLESIIKSYQDSCSSFNHSKSVITKDFKGSEHISKAFLDINNAFKNESINEANFLKYLALVQEQRVKLSEVERKIVDLSKKANEIKGFLSSLKEFSERFSEYIGDINKRIEILLRTSCKDNLELHNSLCSDKASNYLEVKENASKDEKPKMISEFTDLLNKKAPDINSIENLNFLKNKALYFKRQVRFKTNALHYQIQRCNEAKNHLQNIKNAIRNNLVMNKPDLNSYGDYELKNICLALMNSDYYKNKSTKDREYYSRGYCVSFISSFLRDLAKDERKKEDC